MKVHVFVATTQGLVAIQNIRPIDDADISSIVSVNGTSTIANISTAYHHFVKKGAGIIQQDFGACSYRVNISDRIDHGNSWQLAFYLAHAIEQQGILGDGQVTQGDFVICATGEVNTSSREVQGVAQVPLKQSLAKKKVAQWTNQGAEVVFLLPISNQEDIKTGVNAQVVGSLSQALSYLPIEFRQIDIKTNLQDNNVPTSDSPNVNSLFRDGLLPEAIGKYKLIKVLGSGGFGVVYLAKDPKLDVLVAIKVFIVKDEKTARQVTSAAQDASGVLRQRFADEARLLRELSNDDFIVEMYEFDELEDGTPYYVMPYLPHSLVDEIGKDAFSQGVLADLASEKHPRRIATTKAIVYLKQLSEALAAVHQKGLVHRDIKPANVLLNSQGKVQLCDFGIAKLPDTDHTQTSLAMGSRNYMSPEQKESAKHVQASSDIYSLGVLAYRMFTGQLPEGRYADPINFAPEMEQALNQLILSALNPHADQRPENAQIFLQLLLKSLKQKNSTEEQRQGQDESKTWVNEKDQQHNTDIKAELTPLADLITHTLLAEGEIAYSEQGHIEALAHTIGIDNEVLNTLISRIKQQYSSQLKPLRNWLAMLDKHAENSQGHISEETKSAIISASISLGKSQAFILAKLAASEEKYRQYTNGNKAVEPEISGNIDSVQNNDQNKEKTPYLGKPNDKSKRLSIVWLAILLPIAGFMLFELWQEQTLSVKATPEVKIKLNKSNDVKLLNNNVKAIPLERERDNQQQKVSEVGQSKQSKGNQSSLDNESPPSTIDVNKVALFIQTVPSDSEIELLNSVDTFTQGVKLLPKKYQIKVSHDEYYSETKTVELDEHNNELSFVLKRIAPADITYTVGATRFTLKGIPAGRFTMGCFVDDSVNNVCPQAELPRHEVEIPEFRIMTTEVTFALWNECVKAAGCRYQPDNAGWDDSERPVIKVSYLDINDEFIPWLNNKLGQDFSLPNEVQWEYAARGQRRTLTSVSNNDTDSYVDNGLPYFLYSWGNQASCNQARYGFYSNDCGKKHSTAKVKSFSANAFGLFDMHGNVWEWVQDCWHESYSGAPNSARAWLSASCNKRVVRGGSWVDKAEQLTSASRDKFSPSVRNYIFGFRLVQNN